MYLLQDNPVILENKMILPFCSFTLNNSPLIFSFMFYYLVLVCLPPKVKKDSVVSCVLDSEAVAWDREKKQIQPFQVLTTRKRKVWGERSTS